MSPFDIRYVILLLSDKIFIFVFTGVKELIHLEVLVSSHSCPIDIQMQLEQLGTPLVSSTWIVQCLINGSKLPTDKTAI